MSGVERDKIKSLIELRENSTKAKLLILGSVDASSIIIKNLFDKNFNADDLKISDSKVSDSKVKNLDIEKEVSLFYCKEISVSDINYEYECIIYGLSLLNKRIDIFELEKIKEIRKKSDKFVLVLTDVESLDLRELSEMKAIIDYNIEAINILSVMDLEIESKYNQWDVLVEGIKACLSENSKIKFMKSQIVDNSFKNKLCDDIVEFYINIFNDLDVETLSEADLVYIQTNMVSEILSLYPHSDEVSSRIIELVERNIVNLINIKREKVRAILKKEEEERLRKEAQEEKKRREEEKIRLAEEARVKAQEEARLAEEARKKQEEEERIRVEKEARLAEEARIKAQEEARLAEEKRKRQEERARRRAQREAKLAEEAKLRAEEEARIEQQRRKREEEEEKRRLEKERLIKEEEARVKAEEECLRREEEERERAEKEAKRKAREEEKRKKAEKDIKEREAKLKQQRLDLIELRKLQEERKILNEKIRKLNKNLRKNHISDKDLSIDDMVIEASFTVDDSTEIEPKHAINEIEARIDGIIYEAIATRMEELVEEVREEIKEKLKDNSII
ncbi:MAG: hypothetical protein ACRDCW_06105 [Sarcina sp.]